jgi:RecA/RadA recombinase
MSKLKMEANILYLDKVQPVNVKWLAFPFLPIGKISLLIGDPGVGKSTVALYIASMLSQGKAVFESSNDPIKGETIYISAEDRADDTLKPRLIAAGADCSQIAVITNIGNDLIADRELLEDAVIKTGARLVVIDPLAAYIGRDADMCRAADMRRMMSGLADIAGKHECAMLIISHLNKSTGTKSLYRGLGSIDIAASARSVMYIERSENDNDIRVISHIKSSLALEGHALAFRIEDGSAISWLGEYDSEIEGVCVENNDDSKRELASNVILSLLSNGPMLGTAVQKACAEADLSESTVNRAKKDLRVRSIRKADGWYWTLD